MSDVWAIDVSRWQGDIDWNAVKSQGVGGAWIKVGGSDGGLYTDSKASRNVNGAASVQLPFGTYYYVRPALGKGREQAEHAVLVGHGQGELWPTLDIEENPNGLTPTQLDEFVVEFNDRVKELTGRDSIVYTGAYSGVGTTSVVARFPLWIANYGLNVPNTLPPTWNPKIPPAWSTWQVWQFNSVTRVVGVPGNVVDQNVVKGEFWSQMANNVILSQEDDMARPLYKFPDGFPHPNAQYPCIDLAKGAYPTPDGVKHGFYWHHMNAIEFMVAVQRGFIDPNNVKLFASGDDQLDQLYGSLPYILPDAQFVDAPGVPAGPVDIAAVAEALKVVPK